jgi:hypothetical protein
MQGKVCRFLATWLKRVSTKTYVTMGSIGLGVSFVKRESFFRKHDRRNEISDLLGNPIGIALGTI